MNYLCYSNSWCANMLHSLIVYWKNLRQEILIEFYSSRIQGWELKVVSRRTLKGKPKFWMVPKFLGLVQCKCLKHCRRQCKCMFREDHQSLPDQRQIRFLWIHESTLRSSNTMQSRVETNGLCIRLHWQADFMKHVEPSILRLVANL
jgi:hypothetical protein